MSDETGNVEILRKAYDRWASSKGASVDDWLAICDADIAFGSIAQGRQEGAEYLAAYTSRDALKEYFGGLTRDWEMIDWIVDHFVAQGDRVVMLGHCTWRYKKTGKIVSTPKADSWRFANGKAVEYFEYYDTAQIATAVV